MGQHYQKWDSLKLWRLISDIKPLKSKGTGYRKLTPRSAITFNTSLSCEEKKDIKYEICVSSLSHNVLKKKNPE